MQINKWLMVAILALATPATVLAARNAGAEYSADWSLETAEGAMQGKIHVAGSKERREMVQEGESMVMILRPDKKSVWSLIPGERMYIEMKPGEKGSGEGDLSKYDIEQTTVGQEVVNGVNTTKSKIILKEKPPKTGKMGGFWWTTREGIVVKIDAISVEKQSKQRIKSELKNLKVGRQDPALFEIPAGYSKMGMPDMGGVMGGFRAKEKKGSGQGEGKPAPKDKGGAGGFGLQDALKLLK